jgi:PIN domain nuclease of toxin-antitoxin system
MKIIIDTHIFLWALSEPSKLEKSKRDQIELLSNTIYVSSISVTEIMIKASIGKLTIDFDVLEMIEKSGFEQLDFTATDALGLKEMPFHHKDPFDRMLISQAQANGFFIMSDDSKFTMYDCKLI